MNASIVQAKNAKLPVNYEHAKQALEKCLTIDECEQWKDLAARLASYAKQADDDALFQTAMKIKGRAIRKMGEILKQIETPKGRPTEKPARVGRLLQTREDIEKATGISPTEQKRFINVANIPKREFEKAIEAEKAPTIHGLAKQGTKPTTPRDHLKGRDPKEFNASIQARGAMRDMAAMCDAITPAIAVRGANDYDLPKMKGWAKTIARWIERVQNELEKSK